MKGMHCSKIPYIIWVHFPSEIDLRNEPTYLRLRMLSSFCNAEKVNSRAKTKQNKWGMWVGNCLVKYMASCLKNKKKSLILSGNLVPVHLSLGAIR